MIAVLLNHHHKGHYFRHVLFFWPLSSHGNHSDDFVNTCSVSAVSLSNGNHSDDFVNTCSVIAVLLGNVPSGTPSRGSDVAVYVYDINLPSLPTPFYSVLVSISVFMALFSCI